MSAAYLALIARRRDRGRGRAHLRSATGENSREIQRCGVRTHVTPICADGAPCGTGRTPRRPTPTLNDGGFAHRQPVEPRTAPRTTRRHARQSTPAALEDADLDDEPPRGAARAKVAGSVEKVASGAKAAAEAARRRSERRCRGPPSRRRGRQHGAALRRAVRGGENRHRRRRHGRRHRHAARCAGGPKAARHADDGKLALLGAGLRELPGTVRRRRARRRRGSQVRRRRSVARRRRRHRGAAHLGRAGAARRRKSSARRPSSWTSSCRVRRSSARVTRWRPH